MFAAHLQLFDLVQHLPPFVRVDLRPKSILDEGIVILYSPQFLPEGLFLNLCCVWLLGWVFGLGVVAGVVFDLHHEFGLPHPYPLLSLLLFLLSVLFVPFAVLLQFGGVQRYQI